MRRAALLTVWAVLLTFGCRERLPETKRLAEARQAQQGGGATGMLQASAPPPFLEKALTGGRLLFEDDFERAEIGDKWKVHSPNWRLTTGEIVNKGAENKGTNNKGMFLLWKLPEKGDLRIEFDVRSDSFTRKDRSGKKTETFPGDIKAEAFNRAPKHHGIGYVFIFGGWHNRHNRVARMEEHGKGAGAVVVNGPARKVKQGHTYRMKVLRVGSTVAWYADDAYLVHYTDSALIRGPHFGFNNWQSALTFDNLKIYAVDPPTAKKAKPKRKGPKAGLPGTKPGKKQRQNSKKRGGDAGGVKKAAPRSPGR